MNINLIFTILFLTTKSFYITQNNNVLKQNSSFDKLYTDYLQANAKVYPTPSELNFRKRIFENNLSKLITNFDKLEQQYRIIEEVADNKVVKKIILANPKHDCDCELALNKFTDMTDFEFSQTHLLPAEFFDQTKFAPQNQIFEPEEYYPGTSFHGHSNWISNNLNKLLNDPNFDIFKTTLLNRQNTQKPKNYQDINYDSHFIHDNFRSFTLHDVVKTHDQINDYLFDTMPSYDQIMDQDFVDEEDLKCNKNKATLVGEGRNLQAYYGNGGFGGMSSWGNDMFGGNNWENTSTANSFGNTGSNWTTADTGNWGNTTSDWSGDLFSNNSNSRVKKPKFNNNWSTSTSNDWNNWGNTNNLSTNSSFGNSDWTNINPVPKKRNNYTSFSAKKTKNYQKSHIKLDGVKIPTYLNWQAKRAFSPVKDQKNCNACYAFGAISAIEAHNILKNNNYSTYSEQEILDCSPMNKGCVGGQPFMVYDYVKKNGLHKDNYYPYHAKKRSCKRNLRRKKFKKLKGYIFTKTGIKNLLIAANFGPIVVVSYASDHLKYYYKGIFKGQGCTGNELPNHASLLYGYNLKAAKPYLLFKNNWGTGWGNSGYYKVEIGSLNDSNMGHCLIANTPYNTMPLL